MSKKMATLSVYCDYDEQVYSYTLTREERIVDLLFVSAYKLLALSVGGEGGGGGAGNASGTGKVGEGASYGGSSLIIRKDPKGCPAK